MQDQTRQANEETDRCASASIFFAQHSASTTRGSQCWDHMRIIIGFDY